MTRQSALIFAIAGLYLTAIASSKPQQELIGSNNRANIDNLNTKLQELTKFQLIPESRLNSRFNLAESSLIASSEDHLLQDSSANKRDNGQPQTTLNYSLQQDFRANVSNICERDRMQITIRLNRPFFGVIHAREKRKSPACFVEGHGNQVYSLQISYTQLQTDQDYCGVVAHQPYTKTSSQSLARNNLNQSSQQILSFVLVVRLHKTIEFSEDKYFLLSCANRCNRPDCSQVSVTTTNGQQDPRLIQTSPRASMMASESSPQSRFRTSSSLDTQSPDRIGAGSARQISDSGWSILSEVQNCDLLLDMKFKWMSRLCLILMALTTLLLVIVACLCLAMRSKRRSSRRAAKLHLTDGHFSPQTERYVPWRDTRSNNSTDSITSEHATSNSTYISHDRSQQRSAISHQAFLFGQQSKGSSPIIQANGPIMGRSMDTFGRGKKMVTSRGQTNESSLVSRRRSIGSSTRQANETIERSYQAPTEELFNSANLSEGGRAKSRSQVTIHYEQSQDPFKANPFNGLMNAGYMSDGAAIPHVQTAVDPYEVLAARNIEGGFTLIKRPQTDSEPNEFQILGQIKAPVTGQASLTHISLAGDHGEWPQRVSSTTNQNATSQFDPQNSRQLIDLLQKKHRTQLAQANLTASAIQHDDLVNESQSRNSKMFDRNWR